MADPVGAVKYSLGVVHFLVVYSHTFYQYANDQTHPHIQYRHHDCAYQMVPADDDEPTIEASDAEVLPEGVDSAARAD